jgi:glycosyltransferase involved in cell wall biosynthesis
MMRNTNRKPKILQVLGGPGGTWGGGGVVVMSITSQLLKQDCPVSALCLSDLSARRFAEAGATVVTSRFWKRAIHPLFDLIAFWELFRLCRREKFDIVNTHTSKGGFLGRLAARLAGVPVVVHTAHGYVFNEVDSKLSAVFYLYLEKFASYFCDLIISVNEEERLIAIEKKVTHPDKIVTVLNGINVGKFENVGATDSLRRELDPSGDAILIGATGRLMPQKGFVYLVKAMPAILAACPQARFVFVGDGPLEQALKSLADDLHVSESCLFLGFREDVPKLLNVFDIFALPSLWEGLSISLLEAMAAGKPVVTTNIKGNREVIDHGTDGLLVSPANPEALADAVIELVHDKARAETLGQRARQKIKTSFSEEAMVSHTLELYAATYVRKTSDHPHISWSG